LEKKSLPPAENSNTPPFTTFQVIFIFKKPDNTLLTNVTIYGAPEGNESKYLGQPTPRGG